jgi:hypothetical protein
VPRPRYLITAAFIVLCIVVIATMRARLGLIGHVNLVGTTAPRPPVETMTGDAPWALSALPGCFHQRSEMRGTDAYVRGAIPPAMREVPSGSHLAFGPCTISVAEREVYVSRGSDRLRVPPTATLYRDAGALALLYEHDGQRVLRIYDIVTDQE